MVLHVSSNIYLESLAQHQAIPLYDLANRNRAYLGKWLPWVEHMHDSSFISNFIKNSLQRYAQGTEEAFVIVFENKIVGRIGLYKIDTYNCACEIGYWIGEEFAGNGIVSDCTKALMQHAHNVYHIHRVEIRCATDNERSKKIPVRLGFALEGTLKDAEKMHGNYLNIEVYAYLQ
ncbi:MAG: GNAT family N-acetyltransferase [Bacteroidetes bacterium]|nr:GNAT family N-acetyltransferase [Bacteroidota bacterium]